MKIVEKTFQYSHSAEVIFLTYMNEDFIKDKALSLGNRNLEIEFEEEENEVRVTIHMEVPAEGPTGIEQFMGAWNKATQVELWTWEKDGGPYQCAMTMKVKGAPIKITGTMQLTSNEAGSQAVFVSNLDSNFPLLGRRIENFVGGKLEEGLELECKFIESQAADSKYL